MTATSVTGLFNNGAGSVDGNQKGSQHMSLGVEKLIGPRVVAAGTVTCASNVATVTFPQPLDGSQSGYVVMLCSQDSAINASEMTVTAKTNDSNGDFASFAIAATDAAQVVMYAVIKIS